MDNVLKKFIVSNKIKCRYINIEDDRVYLGIELSRKDGRDILRKLRRLNLTPVSITYGRWVFTIRGD